MGRKLVRWAILTIILLTVIIGPIEPLQYFNPFAVQPPKALAQEPTPAPAATSTVVVVPVPTPTPTPEPVIAPSPDASPAIDAPAAAETATPISIVPSTARPTPTTDPTVALPTSTPEPSATPEPTPPADLPPLADRLMPPGTSAEATVDRSGGTVSSPDGRVTIEFPAAAVPEPLTVKITRLDTNELPPLPGQPFVAAWRFEAFAPGRSMARVDRFPSDVTVELRYKASDLIDRSPETLRLWTLDAETGEWQAVDTSYDTKNRGQIARLSHFSDYGEGADKAVEMAPYIHDYEVGLYSGSSQTTIPIDVPASPGGLAPSLQLTYDSGRIDSMKDDAAVGSWVGIGWDLTTGSVKREESFDPDSPDRYSLEMQGVGSELVYKDGKWWLRDEAFYRISKQIVGDIDEWTVTDKSGAKYIFGGTANTARYYYYRNDAGNPSKRWYQWDLRRVEDIHGNAIDYAYSQVIVDTTAGEYVRSSYPDTITYDNGNVVIKFNVSYDETVDGLDVRYDTPKGWSWYPGPGVGPIPAVTETRRLDSIEVKVAAGGSQQLVRKYAMQYETVSAPWNPLPTQWRDAGTHKLVSLKLLDRDGNENSPLYTSTFTYEDNHFGLASWDENDWRCEFSSYNVFNRPYLSVANNGFGGSTQFTYHEEPDPLGKSTLLGSHYCGGDLSAETGWTRQTVYQRKQAFRAGQPDVITSYEYRDDSGVPSGPKDWGGEFHGYAQVTEREGQTAESVTLRPNASGRYSGPYMQWETQWPSDGSAHWSLLDEDPPDDDATRIGSATIGRRDSVNFTETGIPASSTIQKITVKWRWRQLAAGSTAGVYVFIRDNDEDYDVRDSPFTTDQTSYTEESITLVNNPATGGAWRRSDLNSLELGLRVSGGQPVVTQLSVDVEYDDHAAAVNHTKHYFFTDNNDVEETKSGREYKTEVYGADGARWSKTENTWGVTTLCASTAHNEYSGEELSSAIDSTSQSLHVTGLGPFVVGQTIKVESEQMHVNGISDHSILTVSRGANGTTKKAHAAYTHVVMSKDCTNFVHLDKVQTYPVKGSDSTVIEMDYVYDTAYFGDVTKVTELGRGSADLNQQRVTERAYQHPLSTDPFIVVPKWEKVYPPGSPTNVLALTNYYYDGATSIDTKPTLGNLTAVSKQATGGGSPTYASTYTAYDTYGNAIEVSMPKAGLPSGGGIPSDVAKTVTTYDSTYHTYPTQVSKQSPNSNPPTQTTTFQYDYVLGVITSRTEPSSRTTHIGYDTFGRPLDVWDDYDPFYDLTGPQGVPDGRPDSPTKRFEYHWDAAQDYKWTTTLQRTMYGLTLSQTVCFDGFGRKLQTRVPWYYSSIVEAVKYDSRGFVQYGANYQDDVVGCRDFDESKPRTVTTYDPLGNILTVTNPDGTSRSEDHSTLTATFIDENSHKKTATQNGFGQTVQVQEYTGDYPNTTLYATTSYAYDRLGNLTAVTDDLGNPTTMGHDMLGRKTSMNDMDMGAWSYEYDAASNLIEQTDALPRVTNLQYDALGRLKTKTGDGISVTYTYDSYDPGFCTQAAGTALGQTTKMVDSSGTTRWCYDLRGRVVRERKTVDGVNYDVSRTYDSADRVVDLTYPDGEVVHSYYHDTTHGKLAGVYSSTFGYSSYFFASYTLDRLELDYLYLGSSPTMYVNYDYDGRGRLTNVDTGTLQHLDYAFDGVGNVQSITDNIVQPAEVTTFTYDEVNRLKTASGGYSASYAYSTNGKLMTKSEQYNYTLSYNDAAHKHAATSTVSNNGGGTFTMTYDANGNMLTENGDTFTYNGDNQLVTRTNGGVTTTYTYDGKGSLVRKSSTDGTWTVYIGGIYEKHQDGSYVTYYNGFGRRIAMRTHTGPGDPGTKHFFLSDQLGSTSTVLSATGTVEESAKYYPYGSLRSGSITLTDKKFTGQQEEGTAFGLYDYGARFYSTMLGRFVSADPLMANSSALITNLALSSVQGSNMPAKAGTFGASRAPNDPRSLDRYSYVLNNPLRYTDPTGLDVNSDPRWNTDEEAIWARMHGLADQGYSAAEIKRILTGDTTTTKGDLAVGYALSAVMLPNSYGYGKTGYWDPESKTWKWDCTGFVQFAYKQAGVTIAKFSQTQHDTIKPISSSELLPGDLIFYQHTYWDPDWGDATDLENYAAHRWTHVAMYVGQGKIVVMDEAGDAHVDFLATYEPGYLAADSYRRPYY